MTIKCIGIDAVEGPQKSLINKIRIFEGKIRVLRDCFGVFDVGRECHYNITATKSLSYNCQFNADKSKHTCVASQNLTVTEDSKEVF